MLLDKVADTLRLAANQCLALQKDDGSWCGEVLSNTTFTAQLVFLRFQLGLAFDSSEVDGLTRWMLSQQNQDGSWGLGPGCPGDVSTTTESYLALKILGLPIHDARMSAARDVIIKLGGLPACRMFTRVFLASFGLIPWSALPSLPPELIMMPTVVPINIYHMSSWARATCVPLLLIRHHEPLYALPNGIGITANNPYLDELWADSIKRDFSYAKPLRALLKRRDAAGIFFTVGDSVLSTLGRYLSSPIRGIARRQVIHWILDHQEESGEWAGYWPPQHNNIWALSLEGYKLDHPVMRKALAGMSTFIRRDEAGIRVQVTVSQVWDTALMSIALSDSGSNSSTMAASRKTVDWIFNKEVSSHRGDWRVLRPHLATGGWCFEEFNTRYPDVDDSCAVVLALLKKDPAHLASNPVRRAVKWILGMQNNDGGWGAFDVDNNKQFLNKIPFSDMDSLCDPSTPDVTGRILECWGLILSQPGGFSVVDDAKLVRQLRDSAGLALQYLLREQKPYGAWYGRWGVNYVYGTSNVLNGLHYYYNGGDKRLQTAIYRAVTWMQSCQNADGGWGESPNSYSDESQAGNGPSTAAQTAWALMALLNFLPADNQGIVRGVRWLVEAQTRLDETKSTWPAGEQFTATGFPGHLHLQYDYYRHYFPIMALGRYVSKIHTSEKEASLGYFVSRYNEARAESLV